MLVLAHRTCRTRRIWIEELLTCLEDRSEQVLRRAAVPFYPTLFVLFVFARSRLLQGGALSDREEADAIRELEVSVRACHAQWGSNGRMREPSR